MIEGLMAEARKSEFDASERTMMQRREWETLHKIEKLEHELEAARTRLHITPAAVSR